MLLIPNYVIDEVNYYTWYRRKRQFSHVRKGILQVNHSIVGCLAFEGQFIAFSGNRFLKQRPDGTLPTERIGRAEDMMDAIHKDFPMIPMQDISSSVSFDFKFNKRWWQFYDVLFIEPASKINFKSCKSSPQFNYDTFGRQTALAFGLFLFRRQRKNGTGVI